ncbi:hypothetical protein [Nonomuraea fuscirosea]|uniref:hypothetical protein n=1 Tax=Nonomuraea fuscirosea TaxID=1291556 RepID=UPI00340E7C31
MDAYFQPPARCRNSQVDAVRSAVPYRVGQGLGRDAVRRRLGRSRERGQRGRRARVCTGIEAGGEVRQRGEEAHVVEGRWARVLDDLADLAQAPRGFARPGRRSPRGRGRRAPPRPGRAVIVSVQSLVVQREAERGTVASLAR